MLPSTLRWLGSDKLFNVAYETHYQAFGSAAVQSSDNFMLNYMLTILWLLSDSLPSCLTCIEASPKTKVEPLSPQHRWESPAVTSITPLNSAMLTPVCLPGLHVDHFWSWTQLINHFSNQCTSYSAFCYTHIPPFHKPLPPKPFGTQNHFFDISTMAAH